MRPAESVHPVGIDKIVTRSQTLETYLNGENVELFETMPREGTARGRPSIVIAHGWGAGHAYMNETAQALAEANEHVITMDYPRSKVYAGNTLLPRQAGLQAAIDHTYEKTNRPVHLVGHSTGGIDAARTAALFVAAGEGYKISGISFLASAGILDDSEDWEVALGAVQEMGDQLHNPVGIAKKFSDLALGCVHMLNNPRLLNAERKEVVHTAMMDEILTLAAHDDAPHLRFLRCKRDRLFSDAKVEALLSELLTDTTIDFEVIDALHTDFACKHPDLLDSVIRHTGDAKSVWDIRHHGDRRTRHLTLVG